ncbi:MAG TPA: hypothetical protein VGH27_14820 [Streptosporangiaceae bacterium]
MAISAGVAAGRSVAKLAGALASSHAVIRDQDSSTRSVLMLPTMAAGYDNDAELNRPSQSELR